MNKCLLCSTKTDGRPAFYADRDWYVGMFENEMDISYYPKGSDEIVPITFPIIVRVAEESCGKKGVNHEIQ